MSGTKRADERQPPSVTAVLHVDGASFSNPGPSGAGIVLTVDGEVVEERAVDLGWGTNNEAEYRALLEGLRTAAERGLRDVTVVSDSQLLVRQVTGEYKVKEPRLRTLKQQVDARLLDFDDVRFEHTLRGGNEAADALAKAGAEAAKARGAAPLGQAELLE
jgi:ribonuclease HI